MQNGVPCVTLYPFRTAFNSRLPATTKSFNNPLAGRCFGRNNLARTRRYHPAEIHRSNVAGATRLTKRRPQRQGTSCGGGVRA